MNKITSANFKIFQNYCYEVTIEQKKKKHGLNLKNIRAAVYILNSITIVFGQYVPTNISELTRWNRAIYILL